MNATPHFAQESIPPELWQEIFTSYAAQTPKHPPWILGQINRYWRQLSLYTHCLWSNISLSLEWDEEEECTRMAKEAKAMIQELLTRSGDAPLTLYFCDDSEDDCQEYNEIISLLLLHSHRWRDISLPSSCFNIQKRLGGLDWDVQFPLLSAISIDKTCRIAITPDVLRTCPLLHTLVMNGLSDTLPSFPTLIHSRLKHLELLGQHLIPDLISFLNSLSLPALEVIKIATSSIRERNSRNIYPHMPPTLIRLITRSNCSLKKLCLQASERPTASQLSDLLQYTPRLEHLDIRMNYIIGSNAVIEDIMELFVCEEGRQVLAPYLSNLVIGYNHPVSKMEASVITKVVSSRSESSAAQTLNSVVIVTKRSFTEAGDFIQSLYTLQGLDVAKIMNTACNDVLPTWLRSMINSEPMEEMYSCYAIMTGLALRDSEEQRLKRTFLQIFFLLDIFHVYYPHDKYRSIRQMGMLGLIAQSKDKLHHRKWMFVGDRSMAYISPNHKIRKSRHMWDLILGGCGEYFTGGGELIPYLTNETESYPNFLYHRPNYSMVSDYLLNA